MDEYHEHREDCPFTFAPLDVCDCVQKNMAARIAALEARVAAADKLAAAAGELSLSKYGLKAARVRTALAAYEATKEATT